MKLNSKCWHLGRITGVSETTIFAAARSDVADDEFFFTEAEAWEAEATRALKEAGNLEHRAQVERKKAVDATEMAERCRERDK